MSIIRQTVRRISIKFESPLRFALEGEDIDQLHVNRTAYVLLASVFNVHNTAFTYGKFGKAMADLGFLDDWEAGILRLEEGEIKAQRFAYNPGLLSLDTLVEREVQDAWCMHVQQYYGWSFPCFTTN